MATAGFPIETVNDFIKNLDPITLADIEGIPLDPGAIGILPAAYVFDGTKTPAADGYTLGTGTASVVSTRAPVTKRIAFKALKFTLQSLYLWIFRQVRPLRFGAMW